MKILRYLKSLREKIQNPREKKDQQTDHTHVPPAHLSPYRHRAVQNHPTAEEIQHRSAERYYWQEQLRLAKELNDVTRTLNRITGWGTVVAVGGLFLLLCTLWATWKAVIAARSEADAAWKAAKTADEALAETRESSRVDQRAWVVVTGITLVPTTIRNRLEFTIGMRNTGKTPALRATVRAVLSEHAPSDLEAFDADVQRVQNPAYLMLPPETTVGDLPVHTPIPISDEFVVEFNKGGAAASVFGVITYEDVFSSTPSTFHVTRFCIVYRRGEGNPLRPRWCGQKDYNYMD